MNEPQASEPMSTALGLGPLAGRDSIPTPSEREAAPHDEPQAPAPAAAVATEVVLPVASPNDIILVRRAGRELAEDVGLSGTDVTLVVTAISEVLRNIVEHAGRGTVTMAVVRERGREGILVIADDQGPGIPDCDLAMTDGWSSSGSMGMGLPGARRLVDEFHLRSSPGEGTTVRMVKWAPPAEAELPVTSGPPA